MPIIACINQKGGVGKTSTCHHLAGALALDGHRVLLVDNDPQASLTKGLHGPEFARGLDRGRSIAALYRDAAGLGDVAAGTPIAGIDLVPGHRELGEWNLARPDQAPPGLRECLRWALASAAATWDWILIDCPPNLHLCAWAALAASTHYLIPAQPEDYGVQGIADVLEFAGSVRLADNPGLRELGVLQTMVNSRLTEHKTYDRALRADLGDLILDGRIPYLRDYKTAITLRRPVSHHAPKSDAAEAIRGLAAELARRLDASAGAGRGREVGCG